MKKVSVGTILWFLVLAVTAVAADLKPETVEPWAEYVKAADARHANHLAQGGFLKSDEIPGQAAKLRGGLVVVAPAGPHIPRKVPSGLIHDWIGAAFIPNAKLDEVLPVLRDYDRYKGYYHPHVIDSRRIALSESKDRFAMVLMNKSVLAKTALDADYQSQSTRLDDHRWYSVADATRIQEIVDYGTPSQHFLPENHGTGLIWHLHTITRIQERDGGVYIEIEAIALSRDIPAALRFFVEPIVRRVSRSSLATSLQQTEEAVHSHSGVQTVASARR